MNLAITKEKVIEAASKCPAAKETLQTLFPEVFDKHFDLTKLRPGKEASFFDYSSAIEAGFESYNFIQVRGAGNLEGKGFYLSDHYNWELVKDSVDQLVLVPTRK